MSELIFKSAKEMPDAPVSVFDSRVNRTGSWRNIRPVLQEKLAPCQNACAARIPIPTYLDLFQNGKEDEAIELILARNPFPAITGRVCPHPCERACNRKEFDEPIAIRSIERYLGDKALDKPIKPTVSGSGRKVAVVGSGPAGLSAAYYLTLYGHKVLVFEKESEFGGLLACGIPEYRFPRDILKKVLKNLEEAGGEFRANSEIGRDFELDDLRAQYDAVFLATGAHVERSMGIEGEEHTIPGLELLKDIQRGRAKSPGERVAVIGGGNVAMDVARTLLRFGSIPVVLYRRTRNEMPAIPEEVERAMEESIEFQFLTLPTAVSKKDGKLILRSIRMKLGEPDSSGRRRPIPIEGSEFNLEFDAMVKAIGELADMSYIPKEMLDKDGWVEFSPETCATKLEKVFAGGDLVLGPATVVEAFAHGRRAALAIHGLFSGKQEPFHNDPEEIVEYDNIRSWYFAHEPREKPEELSLQERVRSLDREEIKGFSAEQALSEAKRCFSCGHCNSCGNCWVFCPDMSVKWTDEDKPEFDYDYCKGCGICSAECPRGVISLEREREF